MKKIAFFFILLISLVIIAGCNNTRKSVTRFAPESSDKETEEKVTITKVEDEEDKTEMPPIDITGINGEDVMEKEVPFKITSSNSKRIESAKGYHLIEGTTPKNTDKIIVNGYALSKYKSGETQWSYIAAVSLGTLKKGENNFTVKAVNERGSTLASESFVILYGGNDVGILAPTGNNLNLALLIGFMASATFALRKRFQF